MAFGMGSQAWQDYLGRQKAQSEGLRARIRGTSIPQGEETALRNANPIDTDFTKALIMAIYRALGMTGTRNEQMALGRAYNVAPMQMLQASSAGSPAGDIGIDQTYLKNWLTAPGGAGGWALTQARDYQRDLVTRLKEAQGRERLGVDPNTNLPISDPNWDWNAFLQNNPEYLAALLGQGQHGAYGRWANNVLAAALSSGMSRQEADPNWIPNWLEELLGQMPYTGITPRPGGPRSQESYRPGVQGVDQYVNRY